MKEKNNSVGLSFATETELNNYMQGKQKPKTKGYEQLQAIITEIIEQQDFPSWNFLNGVLDCKKILGKFELWFWWGELIIVPEDRMYEEGLTAGKLDVLDYWKIEKDGKITLIGKKR